MNEPDKKWYKALDYLSKFTFDEVIELKKKNLKEYRKYVSDRLENTLEKHQFIIFREDITNVITKKGVDELRYLEDINRKDLTLIASVVAVVLSLVALAKSMGWL